MFYIREEDGTIRQTDCAEWAQWFSHGGRTGIKQTTLSDGRRVSTVFLGVDHGYGGVPLLFETMVFGVSGDSLDQQRYSTEDEARQGHAEIVAALTD